MPALDFNGIIEANGGSGGLSDGFTFQLEALEVPNDVTEIPVGEYTIETTIEGCPEVIRTTFEVLGDDLFIEWSDLLNNESTNTTRWDVDQAAGSILETSGNSIFTVDAGVGLRSVELKMFRLLDHCQLIQP